MEHQGCIGNHWHSHPPLVMRSIQDLEVHCASMPKPDAQWNLVGKLDFAPLSLHMDTDAGNEERNMPYHNNLWAA
jgi:hypothetical protein